MGMYDEYEDIQLKVGENMMTTYKVGDKVEIPDGVYVGNEGAVVIKDGIFIMTTTNVQDKWGGPIDIYGSNPVVKVLKEIEIEKEEKDEETI